MQGQTQGRKTISVDEAAQELGLSRASVYEAAKRGELPAIVIGRRILILRRGLDELWAGRHYAEAESERAGGS